MRFVSFSCFPYNSWRAAYPQSSLSDSISFYSNPKFSFLSLLSFLPILLVVSFILSSFQSGPTNHDPRFSCRICVKKVSEVNRAKEVQFVEGIVTSKFRAHFDTSRLSMKQFSKWVVYSRIILMMKIMTVMRLNKCASSKSFRLTIFASFSDLYLREMDVE